MEKQTHTMKSLQTQVDSLSDIPITFNKESKLLIDENEKSGKKKSIYFK